MVDRGWLAYDDDGIKAKWPKLQPQDPLGLALGTGSDSVSDSESESESAAAPVSNSSESTTLPVSSFNSVSSL